MNATSISPAHQGIARLRRLLTQLLSIRGVLQKSQQILVGTWCREGNAIGQRVGIRLRRRCLANKQAEGIEGQQRAR